MLGYRQPNNDIYIFLENDETKRLEREKIQGTYFNLKNIKKTGLLEASINNNLKNKIKTSIKRDEKGGVLTWLLLEVKEETYWRFIEKGNYESHEGYRHIFLIDVSKINTLSLSFQANYQQLKYWQSQNSKNEDD